MSDEPGAAESLAARVRGLVATDTSVQEAVREIVAQVREAGDAALVELTRRFDTGDAAAGPVRVPRAELDAALVALDADVRAGLELAIVNVAEVALVALAEDRELELAQGQRIVLREVPVRRAAVYVPGGRAPYPSTVVMGAVTAETAGVGEVVVCSPPRSGGSVDPLVLGTCALCGVEEVYAIGGAQAVAALAFGTESVRPVDVLVGPGNLYVQEAKRQLQGRIGIDGFAGPTDLLILLDADADPALAVLDLLAQAEHGADSLVCAVSPEGPALDAIEAALERAGGEANCALVDAGDLDAALAFAEAFAPEHLQLLGAGAEALAPRVRSAGCVFVGAPSTAAFGDYIAGTNHVLPTDGSARFSSALSPGHFRRRMAEVHIGPAAAALARAAAPIARAEGFEAHAASMEARIQENGQ
ncbi:MAG TPA: histidinol dehydrogenase [Solirubrobacteraceae bacterium]|nr:histidinol dehydrogenase [Solirubrobacteraceae bacterium]